MKASCTISLALVAFATTFDSQLNAQSLKIGHLVNSLSNKAVHNANIWHLDELSHTNDVGYFQVHAEPGDSIVIEHEHYEDLVILAPAKSKFLVPLTPIQDFLSYEGGIQEFYKVLEEHLQYPSSAIKKKITGEVLVVFTIGDKGDTEIVEIQNDPDQVFSKTIKKAFKSIHGKWSLDYNGHVFGLPIYFHVGDQTPELTVDQELDFLLESITITAL